MSYPTKYMVRKEHVIDKSEEENFIKSILFNFLMTYSRLPYNVYLPSGQAFCYTDFMIPSYFLIFILNCSKVKFFELGGEGRHPLIYSYVKVHDMKLRCNSICDISCTT